MTSPYAFRRPVTALALAACLLTGCNRQQRAIDAAKKDVAANGQPEEVIYTDGSGNTTTTMVAPAPPGSTQPLLTQSVASAGSSGTAGLPDWSNGHRPELKHAARYRAPGALVEPPQPAEPGSATDPNAKTAIVTPTPDTGAAAPGDLPAANEPAPPANFTPTDVTIPKGTGLAIRIDQKIEVKHAHPGDRFTGALAEGVRGDGGKILLPRGTHVRGVIDAAHKRGHFKGRSVLQLRLTSLEYNGKRYPLETADFVASKKGKGKRTAGFIGGTTGVGMLVGGIATGGVGLAAGALAGGGLGTLLAGVTGNHDVTIPAESLVRFRLEDSLTVQPAEANAQ